MENYIGIKVVKAEPMTATEAIEKGFLRLNEGETPKEENGFHVIYPDGYNSWSPESTFTKCYGNLTPLGLTAIGMTSKDYKQRFVAEYEQLRIRYMALEAMIKKMRNYTLDFNPTCSIKDFDYQLSSMRQYAVALMHRASKENIPLIPFPFEEINGI